MDPFVQKALVLLAIPAGVMGVTLAVARLLPSGRRALAVALALAAAYALSHGLIAGWPELPPTAALEWLPWLGALALVPAALKGPVSVSMLLGLAALISWALLSRLPASDLGEGLERALLFAGTGAALLVLLLPLRLTGQRLLALPGVLALTAGASAVVAVFSHSAKLAELQGTLAVGLALVALTGLVRPCEQLARGAATVGAVLLVAQLLFLRHFVEPPGVELLLLAAGPASLHLLRLPALRPLSGRKAQVVPGLIAALPVIAALVLGALRRQDSLY